MGMKTKVSIAKSQDASAMLRRRHEAFQNQGGNSNQFCPAIFWKWRAFLMHVRRNAIFRFAARLGHKIDDFDGQLKLNET
jgi:hypothetical protein